MRKYLKKEDFEKCQHISYIALFAAVLGVTIYFKVHILFTPDILVKTDDMRTTRLLGPKYNLLI